MSEWWGDIEFELNETKRWRIGKRQIVVQRKSSEWLIWDQATKEESDEVLHIENVPDAERIVTAPTNRYLLDKTNPRLFVAPALADRSIIVRPGSTLSVLPGENATLFVSTPLWMKCETKQNESTILDLPFWLPSDSWFGLTTMVGELCYAKYTDAKVSLENIKKRSHRAITTIRISNEHIEPLVIQRINLPAPFLSLYADDAQQIWTDTVHLTHNESHNVPSLVIKKLDKTNARLKRISDGRKVADSNIFMRSIKSLIA
jgi:hypothetical protein